MSPKQKENSERINVFFSKSSLDDLKREAQIKGMSVSGLVRMIVLEYLSNKK